MAGPPLCEKIVDGLSRGIEKWELAQLTPSPKFNLETLSVPQLVERPHAVAALRPPPHAIHLSSVSSSPRIDAHD